MKTSTPSYSLGKEAGPALWATMDAPVRQPVQPLANEDRQELLEFLAVRPVHTVIMAGKIRDNGVVSPLNRGTFYAYRNAVGILEGVALIGHASLIEARSPAAVQALARCAQTFSGIHLVVIQQDQFDLFWGSYAGGGQPLRLLSSELLFELRWPAGVLEAVPGLRLATLDDLDLTLSVQSEMAYEQCYVNPLQKDPQGFRERLARRIEQERIYVWVEDGKLLFKADIMADTPEVIYLEGVWVNPQERGRGIGARCVSQMSRTLLTRAPGVCGLTNQNNKVAQNLYRKVGYKLRSRYTLAYLAQR